MQLTQFTDYSLRVLMHLARPSKPGLATISEIADFHRISRHHLVKIVNTLAHHRLVTATRGKGGGIRLARPAHTIGIGEVIRLTEPHMNLLECFDVETNQCVLINHCRLKTMLYKARHAFLAELDDYTLADALANGADVMALRLAANTDGDSPVAPPPKRDGVEKEGN